MNQVRVTMTKHEFTPWFGCGRFMICGKWRHYMKHGIEIPELPEGWKAVAYRRPIMDVDYILLDGDVMFCDQDGLAEHLIVEKIKPRRIVLEETEKNNFKYTNGFYANQVLGGSIHIVDQPRIWRVVDGNEATFRDRVREDLIKNKVIVKEGE